MKKIFGLIGIFALVLTGCSGEDGRDGLDGLDAPTPLVFETTQNMIFDEETGLRISDLVYFTDNDITPLETDVALAYRLERTTTAGEDVWVQIPHNFFLEQGTLQYLFNFNVNGADENKSIEFVMDGDFDLSNANLDASYYQNQTFRVVLIPAAQAQNFTENFSNLESVMNTLKISESDIQKIR